jgi:hypothetical protein
MVADVDPEASSGSGIFLADDPLSNISCLGAFKATFDSYIRLKCCLILLWKQPVMITDLECNLCGDLTNIKTCTYSIHLFCGPPGSVKKKLRRILSLNVNHFLS